MPRIRVTKAHDSAVGALEVGDERDVSEKDARSLMGAGVAELVVPVAEKKAPRKPKKKARRKAKEKGS